MRLLNPRTITGAALWQVSLGVTLIIALASLVGHRLIYWQIEQRVIAELNLYTEHRSRKEDQLFMLARDVQMAIRDAVVQRMESYRTPEALRRFDEIFMRYSDGAIRSRPQFANVLQPVTGWLHRDAVLTDELKQRMVLFFDIVQQYKAVVLTRFADLYFTAPEQLNLGTDPPGLSLWAMSVPADYDQNKEEWAIVADVKHNTTRQTAWTGVYTDSVWNIPMITVATPIDYQGRHIGSVSFDHMIDDLMERLLVTELPHAAHVVFQADGRLIAHSHKMHEIGAGQTPVFMQESNDPALAALLKDVQTHPAREISAYDANSDQYYAVRQLTGPSWYFASLIPGHVVRSQALASAQWVLWAGLASLCLLISVLAVIIRRQVARPLATMTTAATRIAAGETITPLDAGGHAELAQLATAFNDMSARVAERDATLRAEKVELERALNELRNTEERWRAMTEHLSDFIVVLDERLRNVYVSPNIQTILGYTPEERYGKSPLDIVHPDDLPMLTEQIEAARRGDRKRLHFFRYRVRCKDGQFKTLEATASNLLENPAVRGIVTNVRDVTEIVRAEAALEQQRAALHQAEKLSALGSLMAGVAHELNNPLSVVVGRSIMLEDQAHEPQLRNGVHKIRVAAERCARIVKSFLAMARQQQPRFVTVQLESVVHTALEMLEGALREHGITVAVDIAADLPSLHADPDQLHQVFTNLFVNAQHALAETTGPRLISVHARHADNLLIIKVSDTGCGMTPEVLSRAFDPYFTTKPMDKGTGVGLSVSLGMVQAHGGTMSAHSMPNQGTTITIRLPCAQANVAPHASAFAPAPLRAGQRILVVDDEPEITAILREILLADGHDVDVVHCAHDALKQLAIRAYDSVITDLRMPDGDGPALFREIVRRWPAMRDKVIFMTGDNLSANIQAFLTEQRRPLLEKPFVPGDVLRIVASVGN